MEERKMSASSIRQNGIFAVRRPSAQTIGIELEEQKRVRGSIWDAFSSNSTASEQESVSSALKNHYQSTQQQLQVSPYFLNFLDPIDEEIYKEFSTTLIMDNWVIKRSCGISLIAILQILLAITIQYSEMEFYLIPIIYLPLIGIAVAVCYAPKALLNEHIQKLLCAYVIIYGPGFFCIRAWIVKQEFIANLIAPVYMSVIYASNYALGLRFVYSVIVAIVSMTSWFILASFAWFNREKYDQVSIKASEFIWAGIAVVLGMFAMCIFSYLNEWGQRLTFLSSQKLIIYNNKLRKQLKGLEASYTNRIADLESPLEKAINGVKLLLTSPAITGAQIRILHDILLCLNSSNLTAPDLYKQIKTGGVLIDKEEEKWLFNELAREQNSSRPIEEILLDPEHSILATTILPTDQAQNASSSDFAESPTSKSSKIVDVPDISTILNEPIKEILMKVHDYNFPIFEFAALCNNRPLFVMSHQLVVESGLLDKVKLPVQKFMNYMFSVESGYRPNLTFHNSLHAADVLHGINHLCKLEKIKGTFSDLETLAIYVAAAIHDYDHPGVNNNFLIATRDKKALFYNDKSVLENHHCSAAFSLLLKPQNNFLAGLDKNSFTTFRSAVVDMVLATDLAQHFDLLTRFKQKVVTSGTFDPYGNQPDRHILMQMLMKCADVSNPTKEWPIYQEWINRILTEFYNQGDLEKKLGLPISPFMNRDSQGPSAQKGFIEFIVYPLFEALEFWTPLGNLKNDLNRSRDRFCAVESPIPVESPERRSRKLRPLSLALPATADGVRSAAEVTTSPALLHARRASIAGGGRRSSVVQSLRNLAFFQNPRAHSSNSIHALDPARHNPSPDSKNFSPAIKEVESTSSSPDFDGKPKNLKLE